MRGIADERDAVGDDRCAVMEAERIGHPRRDEFHRAEQAARALLELGDEAAFAKLGETGAILFGDGPHERRAMPAPASSTSGSSANGPDGKKISCATLPCGFSCATAPIIAW